MIPFYYHPTPLGYFGKVDQVPNLCFVATRFLHFCYVPLVPLGTYLIHDPQAVSRHPADPPYLIGETGILGMRISMSLKSVLLAWLRAGCTIATIACGILALISSGPYWTQAERIRLILIVAIVGVPCIALFVLSYRWARPGARRVAELFEYLGIPEKDERPRKDDPVGYADVGSDRKVMAGCAAGFVLVLFGALFIMAILDERAAHKQNPRPQQKNAEAARAISKLGGDYFRDGLAEGEPIVNVSFASEPRNVTVVDADLMVLRELTDLQTLDLTKTQVTDEGLKELRELKNLRTLYLEGTKVTDKGLKELKELTNLTDLRLNKTQVTGEGLKELKNLEELDLYNAQITDEGLKELKELKHLERLRLANTKVTDKGLKELRELKNLKWLGLEGTAVTDKGLKELRELKNLEWLGLTGTKVTDEGLKELKELKNLRVLWLNGTQVTDQGLKELKEALPKCDIETQPPSTTPP
jgi:hypothetical protein